MASGSEALVRGEAQYISAPHGILRSFSVATGFAIPGPLLEDLLRRGDFFPRRRRMGPGRGIDAPVLLHVRRKLQRVQADRVRLEALFPSKRVFKTCRGSGGGGEGGGQGRRTRVACAQRIH